MGCDIHVHVEVKIRGKWEHYSCPWVSRDYNLFSKLANVRNDPEDTVGYIEPLDQPRGLPPNVSTVTKFDFDHWAQDAHSESYITAEEIAVVQEWAKNKLAPPRDSMWKTWTWEEAFNGTYLFGNCFAPFLECPEDYPEGLEDVRFCFWFDN